MTKDQMFNQEDRALSNAMDARAERRRHIAAAMASVNFTIGQKVFDLSNIEGVVIESPHAPVLIRVSFDGKGGDWRDLNPNQLSTAVQQRTKGEWITKELQIYPQETGVTLALLTTSGGPNSISNEEAEANAAFICKAVNNHDALLEALKNCIVVMERAQNILIGKDGGTWRMLDTDAAKEAIKNAEGI